MKTLNKNYFDIQVKSKERTQNFGEVFTPEKHVEQMLDMLDKSSWDDEDKVFFEPTCGHGNFVVAVLRRRLKALYKKTKRKKEKSPLLWAIANTINTLWAIDVDKENINETKFRTLKEVLDFAVKNSKKKAIQMIRENELFFIHILCAIDHQIHQNEIITALEKDAKEAKKKSLQTKVSKAWFEEGSHNPIDFDMTWVEVFKKSKGSNLQFKRKQKFIKSILKQNQEIKFSEKLMNQYFI